MSKNLERRHFLKQTSSLALGAGAVGLSGLPGLAAAQERRFEPRAGAWRTFDVTHTVEPADLQGQVQVWIPLPDVDTPWQHTVSQEWGGNASSVQIVADPKSHVRMLQATFAPGVAKPVVRVTSRVQTRSRSIDWQSKGAQAEDPEVLRHALQPTELLPLDGIVKKTALQATAGAKTDVDKARAIYQWVVAQAHRDPKTRGCGVGDIKAMLESGNLGGKCADLNAIFVGLCRSVGVPARDLYGLRLVPSAFGYRELGANPASLKGAQHCRAEAYLKGHGWVAMDPADVLKVMRQETPEWIKDPKNPVAAPVASGLFGNWEGNWMAYNNAHDVALPGEGGKATLPFLMYPQGRNASGRFDEYTPDSFKYMITAKEVTA